MALEPQGSREVQKALEEAKGAEQELLMRELQGHVVKALQSPHANHVLQKAISVMWPSQLPFIISELLSFGSASTIAKHPYGCRVLERLVEFFPAHMMEEMFSDLLKNIPDLCKHPYGNFVVQHLLEHGEERQRQFIVDELCSELYSLATNQNACGVLDKALTYASPGGQRVLVGKILEQEGLLVAIAGKRWGFAAAERLLSSATPSESEEAHRQLSENLELLRRTVSGRQLLDSPAFRAGAHPAPSSSRALVHGDHRS